MEDQRIPSFHVIFNASNIYSMNAQRAISIEYRVAKPFTIISKHLPLALESKQALNFPVMKLL